jgi:hypothetical protein
MPRSSRTAVGQFLLGLTGGFLPLLIETSDLAEQIPAAVFSTVQAIGCLAYCAAILTTAACLVSRRGRPAAMGLLVGLLITTSLALLWVLLAALTVHAPRVEGR